MWTTVCTFRPSQIYRFSFDLIWPFYTRQQIHSNYFDGGQFLHLPMLNHSSSKEMRPKRGIKFRNQISFRAKKSLHWCYLFVDSISIISVYVNGFHSVSEFLFHPFHFNEQTFFDAAHTQIHILTWMLEHTRRSTAFEILKYMFFHMKSTLNESALYIFASLRWR